MSRPNDPPLPPSAARPGILSSSPAAWLGGLGRIPPAKPAEIQEWWEDRVAMVLPQQVGMAYLASWEQDMKEGDSPLLTWVRENCRERCSFTFNALWKEKRGGRLYPYWLNSYMGPLTISKHSFGKAATKDSRLLLSSIRRDVRGALEAPPPWKLVSADFTSCHGYISLALSRDEQLAADLAAGFHETTGAWLLGDDWSPPLRRKLGKKVNNAMTFGMGVEGLQWAVSSLLGTPVPYEMAQTAWNAWWDRFPKLRAFRDRVNRDIAIAQNTKRRLSFTSPSGWVSTFSPAEVQGKIMTGSGRGGGGLAGGRRAIFSAVFRAVEADLLDQTLRHFHAIREHHGSRLVLPMYDGLLFAAPQEGVDFACKALRVCAEAAGADLGIPGLTLTTDL